MADFYSDLAKMASDLLAPTSQGGLGQGKIELTRIMHGVVDPDEPWQPVEEITQTVELRGAARGLTANLVGTEVGGVILVATDKEVICEVPSIGYVAGDILSIDGVPMTILNAERIPAAGVTSAVRFTVRG